MINDFKVWLGAILVGVGLMCATVFACRALDVYRDCQYIKAGYTHKTLPGGYRPQWVKEPSCGLRDTDNKEDK